MSEETQTFEWAGSNYAVNELSVKATAEMQRWVDKSEKDEKGNLKFFDDIAVMMGIVMRGLGVEVTDDALLELPQSKFIALADNITTAMNAITNGAAVVSGGGKSDFLSEPATSSEKPTDGDQPISSN